MATAGGIYTCNLIEAVWKTRAGLTYGILFKLLNRVQFMEEYKTLSTLLYFSDFKMYKICYKAHHIGFHL
jgi:hypothetical protein